MSDVPAWFREPRWSTEDVLELVAQVRGPLHADELADALMARTPPPEPTPPRRLAELEAQLEACRKVRLQLEARVKELEKKG